MYNAVICSKSHAKFLKRVFKELDWEYRAPELFTKKYIRKPIITWIPYAMNRYSGFYQGSQDLKILGTVLRLLVDEKPYLWKTPKVRKKRLLTKNKNDG